MKNTADAGVSCGKPDVLCEIKIEDMGFYEEFGISSCSEHSSIELEQEQMDGDDCVPQSCFMNQPTQLADVSDPSYEQTDSIKENISDKITAEKATEIVSSLGIRDEVSNHQKTSENICNSDVDRSSIGTEFSACSFSPCHDQIDNDEYWNTGVSHGNEPETVKILEELSHIDESRTDMVPPLKIVQSDLCGSTETNCTSLEEVMQMQGESQLDSIVCCGVRPKHLLLDKEIGHAATDFTFSFDKTLDLSQPASFVAQDGRLESIVYDVLNNHTQRMASENRSSVGLSDTSVIQSSVIDFNGNCIEDEKASDNKITLTDNLEWPLKDKLNCTIEYDICRSVNNEGPEEGLVLQHQLFQSCTDKLNSSSVMPDISNAEESQKLSAGAPNSSVTSLETDGRIKKSDLFIDEESIEEHTPKKLLSKRKV